MRIECVWEHNGNDSLLYCSNIIGAFTRGATKEEAINKLPKEIKAYGTWLGEQFSSPFDIIIVQENASNLNIKDADSDVIFETEKVALTKDAYNQLKALVLKSANDFYLLYNSFSNKNISYLPIQNTFYGKVPRTPEEMYQHTKNVNAYYWGEIGITVDNEGTIFENRARGFDILERSGDYLTKGVIVGSYGEQWSLAKVLRRFLWHDRIHAKALYKLGIQTVGSTQIPNVFCFDV